MGLLGVDALVSDFRALKNLAGPAALRKAVRAGARVVRDAARSELGRSRRAQNNIVTRDSRTADRVGAAAQVVIRSQGFYLRFIHGGAKPHIITAGLVQRDRDPKTRAIIKKSMRGKRPRLAIRIGRFTIYRYQVHHPGIKANPFLLRAAQSSDAAVTAAIIGSFQGSLDQIGRD